MGYFNFYILRKLYKNKKFRKFLLSFLLFILFLIIRNNVFAMNVIVENDVNVNVDNQVPTYDIYNYIIQRQKQHQDNFVILCLNPFVNNTEFWTNQLKTVFDYVSDAQDNVYITTSKLQASPNLSQYDIYFFRNPIDSNVETFTDGGLSVELNVARVRATHYRIIYDFYNNTGTLTTETVNSFKIPYILLNYKSDLFLSFLETYRMPERNYTVLLNSILNYVNSIDSVNSDILDELEAISSSLTSLPSQIPNNSQQINSINNKISDILTDNDTVINQNSQMIQQQENINDNIQETNEKIDEVKDTITDSSIDTSSTDLPSISVNDPTQNGLNNVFQSMYNAFCTGEPQDIVFPFPYTNKSIVLPVDYLKNNLLNSGNPWIYNFIQTFWGYLFGCYIVIDVSDKINKIKEGNIEDIEKTNIKEDML